MTKAILSGRSPCKHQALTRVMVHLPTKLCIIDQSWAAARCRLSETNLRVKWEARRRQLLDLGYAVVPGWLQLRCPKGAEKGNVGSIPLCFQCQYIGISHISHIQRIVIWLIQLKLRIFPCRVWFHVQDRSAKPLHRPAGQQQQVAWPLKLESHGCSANFRQFDYHFKSVLSFLSIDIFSLSSSRTLPEVPKSITSFRSLPWWNDNWQDFRSVAERLTTKCKHLPHLFSYDQSHSQGPSGNAPLTSHEQRTARGSGGIKAEGWTRMAQW